jgi:hypothetical protein
MAGQTLTIADCKLLIDLILDCRLPIDRLAIVDCVIGGLAIGDCGGYRRQIAPIPNCQSPMPQSPIANHQ